MARGNKASLSLAAGSRLGFSAFAPLLPCASFALALALLWAPSASAQEKPLTPSAATPPTATPATAAPNTPQTGSTTPPAAKVDTAAPPATTPASNANPNDAATPAVAVKPADESRAPEAITPSISNLAPAGEISLVPPKTSIDPLATLGLKAEQKTDPIILDADLWNRIRNGFNMESLDTPLVQEHEQWYAARPDYIKRLVERGAKYLHHIVEEVEKRGMPMEVALLPVIESAFNPQAYSRARAAGMWQFIPSTGKVFGLQQDALNDHRRDVLASTSAALSYLQKLYGMFNAWDLAFAAYNCGEGCVGRAIAANQKRGLPTNYLALNLPKETKQYVPKLLAIRNIVLSPGSYGVVLDAVPDQPYFAKVTAPARIDLKLAAHLAELSLDDFKALNPSFTKPIAAGSLGYFLLPQDRAEIFRHNLAAYQATRAPLVSWTTYTARAGENLDVIGKRYGISGQSLRFANPGIKERRGKIAQAATLQVPLGRESATIEAKLRQAPPARPVLANFANTANVTNAGAVTTKPPIIAAASADNTKPPQPALQPQIVPMPTITESATAPQSAPASAPVAILSASSSTPETIIVKSGDSIFSISKATGVLMADIKAFNNLSSNAIRVGQKLKLVSQTSKVAENSAPAIAASVMGTTAKAPTPPAARPVQPVKVRTTPLTHTVRRGDTLSGIADTHNLSLSDLIRTNGFSTRTVLKVGAKIKLPS